MNSLVQSDPQPAHLTRERIQARLAAFPKARVKLNLLLWYPCFIYFLWIGYLATLNVRFSSDLQQTHAWVFIFLQALVLFIAIATADAITARFTARWVHVFCATIVHVFFASLYLDSIVYNHTQIHLGRALGILFENGFSRVAANWAAIGVSSSALQTYAAGAMAVLLALPVYVYLLVRLSAGREFQARAWILILLAGLAVWGGSVLKRIDARRGWGSRFHDLVAAMPIHLGWKPSIEGLKLTHMKLRPARDLATAAILPPATNAVSLPDIFIFFLESTRTDCIDAETTPHLLAFSRDCLPLRDAFAASNTSHTSWYSMLTGNQALYFGVEKRAVIHAGSRPLALLRQMGYRVLTFCSSTLDYHSVDVMAFGSNLHLCDQMFDAEKRGIRGTPERDLAVNEAVVAELQKPPGGRLFLIFYHCTHHDYDWPDSHPPPFVPYAKQWKYSDFSIGPEQLRLIKNRYLNAVHFEDSLVGGILDELKRKQQFASSVIFAIGDHGEEFLEHGKLLHASNLYLPQTRVPFLLRFPEGTVPISLLDRSPPVASHVDIFPTLLAYLGVQTKGLVEGESLFDKRANYAIVAAQNGDRDPVQFCIRSANYAAFFQYRSDTEPTALQRTLFLKRITDEFDQPVNVDLDTPEGQRLLSAEFGDALRSLFPETRLSAELK